MAGYPVVIPEVVLDRLRRYLKADPVEVLSRPAGMFGGKSACDFVGSGDGSWDDVLAKYDRIFAYETTA